MLTDSPKGNPVGRVGGGTAGPRRPRGRAAAQEARRRRAFPRARASRAGQDRCGGDGGERAAGARDGVRRRRDSVPAGVGLLDERGHRQGAEQRVARSDERRRSLTIASRPGPGRPLPDRIGCSGCRPSPGRIRPSPVRRDSAPDVTPTRRRTSLPVASVVPMRASPSSGPPVRLTRKNGKEMTMEARLDYLDSPLALKLVRHINSAAAVLMIRPCRPPRTSWSSSGPARSTAAVSAPTCTSRTPCTRGKPAAAQPGRGVAGGDGLHRGRAGRAGARRAGHPHRRRRRRRHRRGLGERGQALRR